MEVSALMASIGTCANALVDLLDPTAELVSTHALIFHFIRFAVLLKDVNVHSQHYFDKLDYYSSAHAGKTVIAHDKPFFHRLDIF